MEVPDRIEVVQKLNLCYNCLRGSHAVHKCTTTSSCKQCGRRHHSLIHRAKPTGQNAPTTGNNPSLTHHAQTFNTIGQTLLATAIVHVRDVEGVQQQVRVLLDGGSDTHIISRKCIRRLGIRYNKKQALVTGLSEVPVGTTQGIVDLEFSPHFNSSLIIGAKDTCVMHTVTTHLPLHPCNANLSHLNSLELADETWHNPGEIDMLLGASLFYGLIRGDKITGATGEPFALNSDLGWLVVGEVESTKNNNHAFHVQLSKNDEAPTRVEVSNADLDHRLTTFWELETLPEAVPLTEEEHTCVEHFRSTHSQRDDGKFVVHLPFKSYPPNLGESRDMAIQRLKQLERRLARQPEVSQEYHAFMKEYQELGHMEEVPQNEVMSSNNYYIPHHYVLKEESTTTKLRVVFDASARTTNGKSLNDCLLVGPTIQEPLFNILLRFRTHPVAFTADIAKMYRQILIRKLDTDYQRIVWRESPEHPIKDYRLLTVTYGTGPAPYLATAVVDQHAQNHADEFPLAAVVARRDLYMDDCMSGAETVKEALLLQQQLLDLMKCGGFELRKWSSTHPEVTDALPESLRETKSVLSVELGHTIKALGIYWHPSTDQFFFKIDNLTSTEKKVLTKRCILSDIAKIFDPIGWLAPVVVTAKIMMQQLWKLELGWDHLLPEEIERSWIHYKSQLKQIESIRIPRCIKPSPTSDCQLALLGFSDASEKAYSAVVYLASYSSFSPPSIAIVTSKTRVAPVKTVSLPRLELCAAELLAKLMEKVQQALHLRYQHISGWTDSTTTYDWIQGSPSRWHRFVANRVTKIQTRILPSQWGHVSGIDNPADCASRGIDPSTLSAFMLWWKGPSWLNNGIPSLVVPIHRDSTIDMEERKELVVNKVQVHPFSIILQNSSNFSKLLRMTAWMYRFSRNIQSRISTRKLCSQVSGPLHPEEINNAMEYWVRLTQHQYFPSDIQTLSNSDNPHVGVKSQILALNPFLDSSGLVRVGGRISKSSLAFDQRHPILLPRKSHLTTLLIRYEHERNFHAGPQLLLSIIQAKYWIIRGRDAIRHQIRQCVPCTKQRATTMQQLMADLPKFRVTPARVFTKCGVDYAGPFLLKPMLPRSKTTVKCYMCLFVCCVTRAVHLELVSSLSTEAFIASLRRFIARRGRPSDIYSDCGTNFVGANRELRELTARFANSSHNQEVSNQLANEGIQWHYNAPGSPHHGGIWEAGVKSVKYHLIRTFGTTRLNFEGMSTTFIQIEALLNSRPITQESSDPSDLSALTPGHFLIGAPLTAAPDSDLSHLNAGRLNRWQLIQQLYQSFWRRWSSEYLTRIQQRPKWMKEHKDIAIGYLVTIKDENMPPMRWRLGRVVELHPGTDGHTRIVTLKTKDGTLKRPIVKLCLLPVQGEDSNNDS